MRNFGRAVCMLAALPAAFPILAQAQTTTAYDGTYRGISRQLEGGSFGGGTRGCALPNGVPEPLTILNGVARAGAASPGCYPARHMRLVQRFPSTTVEFGG